MNLNGNLNGNVTENNKKKKNKIRDARYYRTDIWIGR